MKSHLSFILVLLIVTRFNKFYHLLALVVIFALEAMDLGKRAADFAESRAKSLKDDEVVVSINTDDSYSLENVG